MQFPHRIGARALIAAIAGVLACAPDPSGSDDGDDTNADAGTEQPGLDDPTARAWQKAGKWYPEDPAALDEAVAELIGSVDAVPRKAVAIVPPHASLKYSGPTGKEVWARVEIPDTVLILAPDHWGDGEPAAIWTEGPWLIPGHAIEIDRDLLGRVTAALPELVPDREAFMHHETEMLLPWMQYKNPAVKIVPVAFFDNNHREFPDFSLERVEAWGLAVADLMRAEEAAGREVLLVATTDLVHHVPLALADEQDTQAMALIAALDVPGLYDYVVEQQMTICGEIPVAIMMVALRELGYESMEIVARGNSLHANPDDTDIIGYPALALWR